MPTLMFFMVLLCLSNQQPIDSNDSISVVKSLDCGATTSYIAYSAVVKEAKPYHEYLGELGEMKGNGYNLQQMKTAIEKHGGCAVAMRLDFDVLCQVLQNSSADNICLAIVRLDGNHFVLVTQAGSNGLRVLDFPKEEDFVDSKSFNIRWDGTALLVSRLSIDVKVDRSSTWFLAAFGLFGFASVVLVLFYCRNKFSSKSLLIVAGLLFATAEGCNSNHPEIKDIDETPAARKSISVEPPTVSLGIVRNSDPIQSKVEIKNIGLSGLKILKVRSGCGCVNVKVDRFSIPPGESASFVLTAVPKPESSSTTVTIVTEEDEVVIPILWNFKTALEVDKSLLYFSRIPRGEEFYRDVPFSLNDDLDLSMLAVQALPENVFQAEFDIIERAVKLKGRCDEPGRWQGTLRVYNTVDAKRSVIAEFPLIWVCE